MLFADILARVGQRAFVGKVCMDRNAPATYVETTESSLADTERVIAHIGALACPRVQPVITPRFVPTCSAALMRGLAALATRHDALVQSHVSENRDEIAWVQQLHPESASYTACYHEHGLLTRKTILAHGVHLRDDELALLARVGASIVHCANSNFSLASGVCDVRRLLARGVNVALGTDVAGGYAVSMFDAMRAAITASTVVHFGAPAVAPLTYREVFFLATLGGARALALDARIGSLVVGKEFDAIVLDPAAPDGPVDVFEHDSHDERFQKVLFTADDRNVERVFVCGRRVK